MHRYSPFRYAPSASNLSKFVTVVKEAGWQKAFQKVSRRLLKSFVYPIQFHWYKRRKRKFSVDGREYSYFYHPANHTWANERAIEIPMFLAMINERQSRGRILEVGNVLSNYVDAPWDIVDKFDSSGKSINQDVITYRPRTHLYDLIVSISTLEHVGMDDDRRDPLGPMKAIENLRNHCLAEGGLLVFSFPLGHNPDLDTLFFDGKLGLDREVCFRRISKDNRWEVASKDGLRGTMYGRPFKYANGIVLGYSTRKNRS